MRVDNPPGWPIEVDSPETGRRSTTGKLGGRLVVTASLLATVLVVLAVLALAAPRPDGNAASPAPAPKLSAAAARYLAIASAADHSLEVANDRYKRDERDSLAAAESDLRAEVATESLFDKQLAQIPFLPSIASIARALIINNQRRGALTARQARSASLAQLRSFDQRHRATDAAVEVQVRLIRKALHLPPATS